ncbi:unnamed protein product [Jaminaea pallidilutea]
MSTAYEPPISPPFLASSDEEEDEDDHVQDHELHGLSRTTATSHPRRYPLASSSGDAAPSTSRRLTLDEIQIDTTPVAIPDFFVPADLDAHAQRIAAAHRELVRQPNSGRGDTTAPGSRTGGSADHRLRSPGRTPLRADPTTGSLSSRGLASRTGSMQRPASSASSSYDRSQAAATATSEDDNADLSSSAVSAPLSAKRSFDEAALSSSPSQDSTSARSQQVSTSDRGEGSSSGVARRPSFITTADSIARRSRPSSHFKRRRRPVRSDADNRYSEQSEEDEGNDSGIVVARAMQTNRSPSRVTMFPPALGLPTSDLTPNSRSGVPESFSSSVLQSPAFQLQVDAEGNTATESAERRGGQDGGDWADDASDAAAAGSIRSVPLLQIGSETTPAPSSSSASGHAVSANGTTPLDDENPSTAFTSAISMRTGPALDRRNSVGPRSQETAPAMSSTSASTPPSSQGLPPSSNLVHSPTLTHSLSSVPARWTAAADDLDRRLLSLHTEISNTSQQLLQWRRQNESGDQDLTTTSVEDRSRAAESEDSLASIQARSIRTRERLLEVNARAAEIRAHSVAFHAEMSSLHSARGRSWRDNISERADQIVRETRSLRNARLSRQQSQGGGSSSGLLYPSAGPVNTRRVSSYAPPVSAASSAVRPTHHRDLLLPSTQRVSSTAGFANQLSPGSTAATASESSHDSTSAHDASNADVFGLSSHSTSRRAGRRRALQLINARMQADPARSAMASQSSIHSASTDSTTSSPPRSLASSTSLDVPRLPNLRATSPLGVPFGESREAAFNPPRHETSAQTDDWQEPGPLQMPLSSTRRQLHLLPSQQSRSTAQGAGQRSSNESTLQSAQSIQPNRAFAEEADAPASAPPESNDTRLPPMLSAGSQGRRWEPVDVTRLHSQERADLEAIRGLSTTLSSAPSGPVLRHEANTSRSRMAASAEASRESAQGAGATGAPHSSVGTASNAADRRTTQLPRTSMYAATPSGESWRGTSSLLGASSLTEYQRHIDDIRRRHRERLYRSAADFTTIQEPTNLADDSQFRINSSERYGFHESAQQEYPTTSAHPAGTMPRSTSGTIGSPSSPSRRFRGRDRASASNEEWYLLSTFGTTDVFGYRRRDSSHGSTPDFFEQYAPELIHSYGHRAAAANAAAAGVHAADYIDDELFRSDYESLLQLGMTIGEAVPKHTPQRIVDSLRCYTYQCAVRQSKGKGRSRGKEGGQDKANEAGAAAAVVSSPDTSCTICLEEYQARDRLTESWCGHAFHEDCLKTWLGGARTCPLCRERCPSAVSVS